MTDEVRVALLEYVRKVGWGLEPDFLREAIRVLSEALMELEVSQKTGAARYARRDTRTTYRNGYRERTWATRVGAIARRIPKLREGSSFPSLLEPRRQAERALRAVVQQAYIQGVSTRKVDDLVQALGLSSGIDKSAVSRICRELDEVVGQYRQRPLVGAYPYRWLDARYLKVRPARSEPPHREPSGGDRGGRTGDGGARGAGLCGGGERGGSLLARVLAQPGRARAGGGGNWWLATRMRA